MNCELPSCYFYMFLSFLAGISIYLLIYLGIYAYIAYITYKYNANDLISWRENQLVNVENKYNNLPT